MSSDRITALYALPLGRGCGFFRVVGHVEPGRLPFRLFWLEPMVFEDWSSTGKPTKPETDALCRKLGVDVLFVVHVQPTARGRLLLSMIQKAKEENQWNSSAL